MIQAKVKDGMPIGTDDKKVRELDQRLNSVALELRTSVRKVEDEMNKYI